MDLNEKVLEKRTFPLMGIAGIIEILFASKRGMEDIRKSFSVIRRFSAGVLLPDGANLSSLGIYNFISIALFNLEVVVSKRYR